MLLRFILTFSILCFSITSFALSKYFDPLAQNDLNELEEVCSLLHSADAKIIPTKSARQYSDLIRKLQQNYPDLDFSNPCGL